MRRVVRFFLTLMFAIALTFLGGCGLFILGGMIARAEAPTDMDSIVVDANKNWGFVNTRADSHVHAMEARKISKGSVSIKVAVIDTGIDIEHPDLRGHVEPGWDFVTGKEARTDNHGHGTHVAGIIGANANLKTGVNGMANVMMFPVVYYADENPGSVNLKNTVKALRYAIDKGAKIINYSGGGPEFSEEEYAAIRDAGLRGIIVVAAAGNERQDSDVPDQYYYPAAYKLDNLISVAATDINNKLLRSSNWGQRKVDVAAPGENIFSTLPGHGGRYGYMSGTSQATPFVTGIITLMLAKNPNLTPLQVKNILRDSCDKFPELEDKTVCGGRINALTAVKKAGGLK